MKMTMSSNTHVLFGPYSERKLQKFRLELQRSLRGASSSENDRYRVKLENITSLIDTLLEEGTVSIEYASKQTHRSCETTRDYLRQIDFACRPKVSNPHPQF